MTGKLITSKEIGLIFEYRKKYPNMAEDDIARLVSVSRTTVNKILRQKQELEEDPSIIYPTVSGITKYQLATIRDELGFDPNPCSCTSKEEEKNESNFILKIFNALSEINQKLSDIYDSLGSSLKVIRKESYYNGLNDAWEAAKLIALPDNLGGLGMRFPEIFGTNNWAKFMQYTHPKYVVIKLKESGIPLRNSKKEDI